MKELKMMKHNLTSFIQGQMGSLEKVNAKELGEAVDMIKDLSEAIYYCTITEAMEKSAEDKINNTYYYTTNTYPQHETHYYTDGNMSSGNGKMNHYHEGYWPQAFRDEREGKSPMQRRMYMESKELHKNQSAIHELENYLKELSTDITEMVQNATEEEKNLLYNKMMTIASKINNV